MSTPLSQDRIVYLQDLYNKTKNDGKGYHFLIRDLVDLIKMIQINKLEE
jgi:hypothetical protein